MKSRCFDRVSAIRIARCGNETISLNLCTQFTEGVGIHVTCLRFQASLVLMTSRSADNLWFFFEPLKLQEHSSAQMPFSAFHLSSEECGFFSRAKAK